MTNPEANTLSFVLDQNLWTACVRRAVEDHSQYRRHHRTPNRRPRRHRPGPRRTPAGHRLRPGSRLPPTAPKRRSALSRVGDRNVEVHRRSPPEQPARGQKRRPRNRAGRFGRRGVRIHQHLVHVELSLHPPFCVPRQGKVSDKFMPLRAGPGMARADRCRCRRTSSGDDGP